MVHDRSVRGRCWSGVLTSRMPPSCFPPDAQPTRNTRRAQTSAKAGRKNDYDLLTSSDLDRESIWLIIQAIGRWIMSIHSTKFHKVLISSFWVTDRHGWKVENINSRRRRRWIFWSRVPRAVSSTSSSVERFGCARCWSHLAVNWSRLAVSCVSWTCSEFNSRRGLQHAPHGRHTAQHQTTFHYNVSQYSNTNTTSVQMFSGNDYRIRTAPIY